MKKILLTAVAFAALTISVNAQRMTLHEEFTGENCDPCAETNPSFWALCDLAPNPNVLIHISYMSPIPSAGTFYYQDQPVSDARLSYYSIPFAPDGRYDGHIPDPDCSGGADPGHPGCFTQADINAEAAIPDSFAITATNTWNATYDSVTAIITITCNTAWTGTTPYLRVALVENVDFATAPGSNGEKDFEHVVRDMYPNALGTTIPTSWAATATQTYTVTGAVPSYVDKSGSPYVVVWIQDDANKVIAQAAQATPLPPIPLDATISSITTPGSLICAPAGPYTLTHTANLNNNGTATLISATIYYSIDGGTMSSYPWTGSLAAAASTAVVMPSASTTVGPDLYHTIYDSVANLNGTTDLNTDVASASTLFFIENSTAGAVPFYTSFENPNDTNYYATNTLNDGNTWDVYWSGSSTSLAHTGTYAEGTILADWSAGEQNTFALPEINLTDPASSTLTFWEAYAQIATSATDELEVVYSTDCGSTWTSIWNMSGTSMATMAASSSEIVVPTSPSNYAEHTVSLSAVPSGNVIFGYRVTANGGNTIWVDDINVAVTTGVKNLAAAATEINLYPNPAKDQATLSFNLATTSNVQVQVIDELGRTMSIVANDNMAAGTHTFIINTEELANGAYNIMINTASGVSTQRLSVIK